MNRAVRFMREQAAAREFNAASRPFLAEKARLYLQAPLTLRIGESGILEVESHFSLEQERRLALLEQALFLAKETALRNSGLNPEEYPDFLHRRPNAYNGGDLLL